MCTSLLLMIVFIVYLIYKIWFTQKTYKLDGSYINTKLTNFPLLDGSVISIIFKDGYVQANVGCNIIKGLYEIKNGSLIVGPLSMTKINCPEEVAFQDYELLKFLSEKPDVNQDYKGLTLTCRDGIFIQLAKV